MTNTIGKHFIMGACVLALVACQTIDKEVEQLVHQPIRATQKINPYKATFVKQIQGSYTLSDNTTFNIDSSGHFKLGETEYFIHNVIDENRAVYISSTQIEDSSKKVYTYHGIINASDSLLSAPYKTPSQKNSKILTEKETKYYWEVNTFQPNNINWNSGFTTKFADKN